MRMVIFLVKARYRTFGRRDRQTPADRLFCAPCAVGEIHEERLLCSIGRVTAVINASACGVIETARRHRGKIGKVYAGSTGSSGH